MAAALDVGNLVRETSVTTGTGNQTLVAVTGKRTFNTEFGTGGTDVFDYFISNPDAAEWERGTGHMSTSTVLVRDTVIESSNADAAVSFTAGTKAVTNDLPASFHGGQWNLLETVVASNDATIDITGLTSRYFMYKFIWSHILPSTDSRRLWIRTSADNGASFDAGASDYAWVAHEATITDVPFSIPAGDDEDNQINLFDSTLQGNGTDETGAWEITLFNPTTPEYTKIADKGFLHDTSTTDYWTFGAGVRLAAEAVNAVQFLYNSNDIASGILKVYGVRA